MNSKNAQNKKVFKNNPTILNNEEESDVNSASQFMGKRNSNVGQTAPANGTRKSGAKTINVDEL